MVEDIREKVREYYASIAKKEGGGCCSCSSSCCGQANEVLYDFEDVKGLPQEALEMSLGCANPLAIADLKKGEKVLDLGCGGGIDAFIAAKRVGEEGMVFGLDMTDEMIAIANKNKEKMGISNVKFIKGYIEDIPLEDNSVDVVISNCVINLSHDKLAVLKEAYRVLKSPGRLAVADIVILKGIPENLKKNDKLWAGCFAGALAVGEYEKLLREAGFKNIKIKIAGVYGRDEIRDFVEGEEDLEKVAGAFASALIRAEKQ
ncbi:Demethylrebeccamycin-D-glucose O-methyltransferase [Fervidicola ferrireducens]|uniref:Arsenite methyltransferase n=1 Tax=Fervidicola ferrireducens TaxID=520764 RepID=A0A140LCW5_9FIRM|nr:arsenite methyltransferase [Fervidicola ferrireducens]KXG78390.1 Demethylrebeccamycin-D-glucose O-methyltransferase [Fervidicola ferrireducens]